MEERTQTLQGFHDNKYTVFVTVFFFYIVVVVVALVDTGYTAGCAVAVAMLFAMVQWENSRNSISNFSSLGTLPSTQTAIVGSGCKYCKRTVPVARNSFLYVDT